MSITTESLPLANELTYTDVIEPIDDITNIVNGHHKTLMIILAAILPTLACIALLTLLIICYRRRKTAIWSKKLGKFLIVFN